jgi:hypothetical protein
MIVLMNNCHNRKHAQIYKDDRAFYDLRTNDSHAKLANNLQKAQQCVVASRAEGGQIAFDWYSFHRETQMPDKEGIKRRVFFGTFIKSKHYAQADAATVAPYSNFFDKNGHFKRQSVINA